MSKTIKTRIINKHDLAKNWEAATFTSQKGEFYVYDDYNPPKLKIGDGVHTVAELPFAMVTKTSELENNSGFITKQIIPSTINSQFAVSTSGTDLTENMTKNAATSALTTRQRAIAYGNGVWVAGDSAGALQRSTDNGITWTKIPALTNKQGVTETTTITGLTYGKGYFVAVSYGNPAANPVVEGTVYKSTDGLNWSIVETNVAGLSDVNYLGGRFVFVAKAGEVAFSDDLERFQLINIGYAADFATLAYGKDRYFTGTGDSSGNVDTQRIYYSLDGVTWTPVLSDVLAAGNGSDYWGGACYGKGKYLLGGRSRTLNGQTYSIAYSDDCETWLPAVCPSAMFVRAIDYIYGKFFAVGYNGSVGEIWSSLDGINWQVETTGLTRQWVLGCGDDFLLSLGDNGSGMRYVFNIEWLDTEPEISTDEVLWQKTQLRLTDGSLLESEVEVHTNLTALAEQVDKKADTASLAKVATSGSYNDLTNKPTIPSGAAASKGVDTSISAASTSANLPTSAAVAAFVEGKGYKTEDHNTTYAFSTGDSNGQIKVTPSSDGGSAYNVDVKGLGSAAYKATSDFAAASHGTHVTAATVKSALGTGTGTSKYLREDGTWVTPPDTNTWRGIQDNLTSDSTTDSLSAKQGKILKAEVDTKVTANNSITGSTKSKITYDSKGLVTKGEDLTADDIPSLAASKITSGTFDTARIPSLAASKITSGTFADARIASASTWNAKQDKIDANNKLPVAYVNGVASSDADGLMSKTDKDNLDTLVDLLKNDDADTTINTIQEVLDAFANTPEGTNIANALAGKAKVGHTHDVTTKNAAPHTHTHSVTVEGTTGANSGTAVNAVTGYGSFSGGSGSLTADTTSTNGIKYVESVTHGAASLTGTTTFNTDAIKDITLAPSTSSSDGPTYVESVTHTSASLTGTTTFVSKQGTFSAGTTPVASAAPANTTTATTANSGDGLVIGAFANGILTISAGTAAPQGHTHDYDKATGVSLTRGTAPSLGNATTASVGISGGSITPVTKYMKRTTAPASTGTVGISSSAASVTTKYLHHTHTGASLGTASTEAVAPHGHTHSYGSSTALTTGNNSGTAVAAVTSVSPSEE